MAWQGSGGIPGLLPNGEGGISVLGSSVFGGNSQEARIRELDVFGAFFVFDTPGSNQANFMAEIQQQAALLANNNAPALYVDRTALQNGYLFTQPVLVVGDDTGSGQHIAIFYGSANVTVGSAGGIGLFNATPPIAPRTLAQSAITAITDANAKVAVQALANTLADMGALTLT